MIFWADFLLFQLYH